MKENGFVACVGEKTNAYAGVLCGNLKEEDTVKDLGVDGMMLLTVKCIW